MPSTSARRCLFPVVVAPNLPARRIESTRKCFSCINSHPVMLPAKVVTCGQMDRCPCYRFFEILLNVFTEEYEEDGQEAAKYVVTVVPEAKVSVKVAGTAEGLAVTFRDTVLEREAIIVVDINAIKDADSEMREISFDFEDFTHDLKSAKSSLYGFRERKDAEDVTEYALTVTF